MRRWNLSELLAFRLLTQSTDRASSSTSQPSPSRLLSFPPVAMETSPWRFDGDSVSSGLSAETCQALSRWSSPSTARTPQENSHTATGFAPSFR
jgi:hypothetical protein